MAWQPAAAPVVISLQSFMHQSYHEDVHSLYNCYIDFITQKHEQI